MLHLCKNVKGRQYISKDTAASVVATEVSDDWIQKNVYPMSERSIARRLKTEYEVLRTMSKTDNHPTKRPSQSWKDKAIAFNQKMRTRAYDIRCTDRDYEKLLEMKYQVKMTPEDKAFYEDNCHGDYLARCSDRVSISWMKQKRRVEERSQRQEQLLENLILEREEQVRVNLAELEIAMSSVSGSDDDVNSSMDVDYNVESWNSIHTQSRKETRSHDDKGSADEMQFPLVKVRDGTKTFNESLMRCMVKC
ncbi:hypothetical protein SNE40_016359 [Patella caerulea]|uniref:Uncharacterized protein n=1 Tax=Patella caerulea TaxID=87958 RepID=A0AAN8JBR5_PATCE